jgi:hypothetical protein
MQTLCSGQDSSVWTTARHFQTTGCCTVPNEFSYETKLTNNSAQISWENIDVASGYTIRYRSTDVDWAKLYTQDNTISLANLLACTTYEIQILTHCAFAKTDFSPSFYIKTSGCGNCTEQSYCITKAAHTDDEWIETFSIGDFSNTSSKNAGYHFFADQNITLRSNTLVPVSITPGFTGQPYKEFFRIFLDLNADGDFDDDGEIVFDPGFALEAAASGVISIPVIKQKIQTRLRVSMKFAGSPTAKSPEPCEIFGFGEVEDYCVSIEPASTVNQVSEHETSMRIYPQPASANLNVEVPEPAQYIHVYNTLGHLIYTERLNDQTMVNIFVENWKSGFYLMEVNANGRTYNGKFLISHPL